MFQQGSSFNLMFLFRNQVTKKAKYPKDPKLNPSIFNSIQEGQI